MDDLRLTPTPRRATARTQVGLDAAGKTTILYKLKLGEIVTTIPTIGASRERDRGRVRAFWIVGGVCQPRARVAMI